MMRITRTVSAIACGCAIVFGLGLARPSADTTPPVLRFDDRILQHMAQQGLARSATLRALVSHLERSQIIVFAAVSRNLGPGVGGRVRFIGKGEDGWRFVRVELDDRRTRVEILAMFGHELQHVAEIAGDCDVVDEASMAELYNRIGFPSPGARKTPGTTREYETQAAMDVEKRVFSELFGDRW